MQINPLITIFHQTSQSARSSSTFSAIGWGIGVLFIFILAIAIPRLYQSWYKRHPSNSNGTTPFNLHDSFTIPSVLQAHHYRPGHDPDEHSIHRAFYGVDASPTAPPPVRRKRFNPANLKSFVAARSEREKTCVICLDCLGEERVSSGACSHVMHTSCLTDWLLKDAHSSCPICRATYEDGDTVRERENVEGEDGIDAMGELHLPVEEESNAMLAASGQLSGPGTSPMVTECTETNTDINDCVSITLGTDTDAIQPQIAQMA